MRIVIDLQGTQTAGSRGRGIGRYSMSLALAMIRNRGDHEVIVVISDNYPATIAPIQEVFRGVLPPENVRVWRSQTDVTHLEPAHLWRRQTTELAFESFLSSLEPDFILVTSMFEGLGDNAITTVKGLKKTALTAVILYDLIPLIYKDIYLSYPPSALWYDDKIEKLKKADLLLSISESSRSEGIKYLGFPGDRVVNISTAADSHFAIRSISLQAADGVRDRYGFKKPFVMYTGGIDHRKNIEGLIRAFALLPKALRLQHQLAIVCSISDEWRKTLGDLALKSGMAKEEVIFTGFIPEEDLVTMYHLCKVFVFPSWHEGFGLPALEAMSCGAPVIAANTSSLPEVIGRDDALFDPRDDHSIAEKITHVLTDASYRAELVAHGIEQAKKFDWDSIGEKALWAFEQALQKQAALDAMTPKNKKRLKLAFVSPLPPERSGISDYSAELLPALFEHYEIDVVVAQTTVSDGWIKAHCVIRDVSSFLVHAHEYDRVLFHFGNSHFHMHMLDLLSQVPGVVVLHDFYLSGCVYSAEVHGVRPQAWAEALHHSHGYPALADRFGNEDVDYGMKNYPCNLEVLESARSVIVHSEYSRELANEWYGPGYSGGWSTIPLMRIPAPPSNRAAARRALGIDDDVFLVCSFGFMHSTKLNHRLLSAWMASSLSRDRKCMLVFVGQNHGGDYGRELLSLIQVSASRDRIQITGWTDTQRYVEYLAAADVGVQLRTSSRGETSAAVLDCMNYGLATIVNANGSMAALPHDAVWLLPDEFADVELVDALQSVFSDHAVKSRLSARGASHIHEFHAPKICASLYADAIERAYANDDKLAEEIAALEPAQASPEEWLTLANMIAGNRYRPVARQLLVDVSSIAGSDPANGGYYPGTRGLADLLVNPPKGFRVEPVYASTETGGYVYAKKFSLRLLDCPESALEDSRVEVAPDDIYFGLAPMPRAVAELATYFQYLKSHGVKVYFFMSEALEILGSAEEGNLNLETSYAWLKEVGCADGVVATTEVLDELGRLLDVFSPAREQPLPIASIVLRERQSKRPGANRTSARELIGAALGARWNTSWKPDGVIRVWGADKRLHTQVGVRSGRDMLSNEQQGFLVYGPYIPLASGRYVVRVKGSVAFGKLGSARIDATINSGALVLGASTDWVAGEDGYLVSLPLILEAPCRDLEVRVWVSADSVFKLSMLEIAPASVVQTDHRVVELASA